MENSGLPDSCRQLNVVQLGEHLPFPVKESVRNHNKLCCINIDQKFFIEYYAHNQGHFMRKRA